MLIAKFWICHFISLYSIISLNFRIWTEYLDWNFVLKKTERGSMTHPLFPQVQTTNFSSHTLSVFSSWQLISHSGIMSTETYLWFLCLVMLFSNIHIPPRILLRSKHQHRWFHCPLVFIICPVWKACNEWGKELISEKYCVSEVKRSFHRIKIIVKCARSWNNEDKQ